MRLRPVLFALALFGAGTPALAQEAPADAATPPADAAPVEAPRAADPSARTVITTPDGDYFGVDLRAEQNKTLSECQSICLGDGECRAFTYNTRAKRCFLKSDFRTLNPFPGAVAGKVVAASGDLDIGAAPALGFFPDWMAEEARQLRARLTAPRDEDQSAGLATLIRLSDEALNAGDPAAAMAYAEQALRVEPEDPALWLGLSRAALAFSSEDSQAMANAQQTATTGAWTAYDLSRTAAARADALAALAQALDRRDLFRPALSAYEASLDLVNSAAVQAEYEDLKARKGFRVVEHTIDADTVTPRVCAVFSEDLVKAGVDYSTFVAVDDRAPKSVEAKGRQVCAGGLEHGRHYRVTFRAGLPSAVGEVLEAPAALSIYVRDRAPSARFTGDSFVLPATARHGVPVVTVNMDEADMRLYRVGERSLAQLLSGYQFLRQLDAYEVSTLAEGLGAPVWEGRLEIANEPNKEVTTSFPLDEALPRRAPGVYVMTAQPVDDRRDSWELRATQWLVVSDIGLSTYTAEDGLSVFARSLGTAKPLDRIELTLLARNNEILGTAATDAGGRAVFTPGLARGTGGMAPAVLVAKSQAGDFVFLDMTRPGFDLSDRGVAGRPAPGPLDVYAWTERGIYRAGETVHVAALARDAQARAVDGVPLTFIFTRPDGAEDRRVASDGQAEGGHAVELPLEANSMRGTWTVKLHTDPAQPAVSEARFLVEDFVPDRVEFDLTADKRKASLREPVQVTVDGRFLYGTPAAGLELEGEVALESTREWARFPGYQFGLADEVEGDRQVLPLGDLPLVGEDGKATFPVVVDAAPATTKLTKAHVSVRMRESGGRAVERSLDIALLPQADVIGIRPGFTGEEVPQGSTASFDVILVGAGGQPAAPKTLNWTLSRVERSYQWYRSGSYWNYEPFTFTTEISSGAVEAAGPMPAKVSVPVDWGRYRLEVTTQDEAGPATNVEFDAGWYVAQASTETPDALEIGLDEPEYRAGDIARLKVTPRFAGELLVTVGADRLLAVHTASVPDEGATIDIPVGEDWGAGAYVTATLFRPGAAEESRMPARAIGVTWMGVDAAARTLAVAVTPEPKMEPNGALVIPVAVTGAGANEEAYVTVAAVDVGILNLTRYEAPNPEGWFFGQRRLGIELRDLYGRLIDGSLGATGRIRTGGDGGSMSAEGSPPTEELVAFFSGIVKLDAAGKAVIAFDIPQFNGTVRVMAVAWTRDAVGHASADVTVRDPVVVTASLPRFLAPGDRAVARLDFANTDGPGGDYTLSVEANGAVVADDAGLPASVTLQPGQRTGLNLALTALEAGDGSVSVRLSHPSGVETAQTLALPVRAPAVPVTTRNVVSLQPGASLRVDSGLLSESLLDGASVSLGVSRSAPFDVASLLLSLDRYPYGCAEQTVSRALPLLYVNEMAAGVELAGDPELKGRIQGAIDGVLNFQSPSGSFGLWGPGYGDLWLDAYVTDFLTRAREAGYDVPANAMLLALNNLQNGVSYDLDLQARGNAIAYSFYVLARNRKASVGDLRYYADTQVEAFTSPMAVAHLAASLALYGDQQRAESTFDAALRLAKATSPGQFNNDPYGSTLRDGAGVLALAAESRPMSSIVPELVQHVANERAEKWQTSTQEQAWMLLAARALAAGNEAIRLEVNGGPHEGALAQEFSGEAIAAAPVTLVNRGSEPVEAVVTAVAAPAEPLPAGGDGFTIQRTYYRLDGSEANVTEAQRNERFVAVLQIQETNDWPSRILVTDLLPAGFVIDNPNLVSSASLSNFDWLPQTEAAHLEFRDDRFVAAFNREAGADRWITLAYVVRATTPGTFAHPAAQVEDMYRPEFSARTAAGMMMVRE
ncbi:MAG TPA: alpha-2-macroglobulin family protein [Mesorhizobium sp.]|jgi:hypothetical protein|nr:alpha-2-macroglobulin family protein [Mesorhizobium sp.]